MDVTEDVIDLVKLWLSGERIPGAAIAVMVDGELVVETGFGFRDRPRKNALPADAQFYIYSITKPLLATITLQFAERGYLALDEPVTRYLPSLPIDAAITTRQLLQHTAGLPDYGTLQEYFDELRENPSEPWTAEEFLERSLAQGPLCAPGQGWQYSNIGYLVVKQLIERISGRTLRQLVAEHIAEPLGLQHTFVAETLEDTAVLTPAWSVMLSKTNKPVNVAQRYHPGWVSHGVVVSTAAETARMLDAISRGYLLQLESLVEMLTPVLLPVRHPNFKQPAYGLGVMIDTESPHGIVFGHGGGGPGYDLGALHFRELRGHMVTGVALLNGDMRDMGIGMAYDVATNVAVQLFGPGRTASFS